ncbi:MAG TPA: tRNA (adenosine(37)-N6)-threonylcarbamoyltransferase complex ATPase subunit type 1 TsaE [Candidatus Paceibacterota bacterium]|nr:tRNA (adenosine(37)-N6)-threonylcarbamoyltransferase complex ATPase subunit type 1 TsaE [Candidatus Paceibacterota bacterium]
MSSEITGSGAMKAEAARFLSTLLPRADGAMVIALSGDLGAGKTTFVQGISEALCVEERVTSPTFVIKKIYELESQPFGRLIHIDAYRLKDAHELETLGWHEIVADPRNLILVDWPERVASLIPANARHLAFEGSGGARYITYG